MSHRRIAALMLLSAYVLFLLDLTWLQFPTRDPVANPVPFRTIVHDWRNGGRDWVVNFLGNLVAFVPIGMIPALARPGRSGVIQAALFGASLSAMIEAVQYINGSRVADVDDILLNTAGSVLGYLVLRLSAWRPRKDRPVAIPRGEGGGPP